ncbi:MAG: alkaline phosphatase family protein [Myxococcales bacterium]|nr:alkaline phosphatase family protein [Myxococcales bacterium]
MPKRLAIAMFVDACGWGIVGPRPWFLDELKERKRVTSLFGYSSACVPAILTGKRPNENDHWSAFYYAPETSPFRPLKALRALPSFVFDRGRVRSWLSKGIAKAYGFTGYFQIYSVPFNVLPFFDYAEKRDIFRPRGINRGQSIFDVLPKLGVKHHVSNWRHSEAENLASLRAAIDDGDIEFAFLYTASLDSLMHDVTKESPKVDDKLRWYQEEVRALLAHARSKYDEVRFVLFSDHGMATVKDVVNLIPQIEATGLRFGDDYAAVYDSTMLRFWFLKPGSEARIRAALPDAAHGRWVTDDEHRAYGTLWDDGRFGDAVYALEPGVLLNPCHMGNVPLKGMHGYRPDAPDSDSAFLASFEPAEEPKVITDYFDLMRDMAEWAHAAG